MTAVSVVLADFYHAGWFNLTSEHLMAFVDSATGAALTFTAPEVYASSVEGYTVTDDLGRSVQGGVKRVTLTEAGVRVELTSKGAAALKTETIVVKVPSDAKPSLEVDLRGFLGLLPEANRFELVAA